ncbi:MAG: HisA/HisF-related TIM barrel protein [Capsulimonadaceae bacterium]
MEIIPVIEIKSGKSAYSTYIRPDQPFLLRDDVILIATRWRDEGAKRIHIHDADGARVGMPHNRDQVRDVVRRVGIPIQYSGGVKTLDIADRVLTWGVERVVVQVDATQDLLVKTALPKYGERIVLEVRTFEEQVAMPAVPRPTWGDLYHFVQHLHMNHGWPRYLCKMILGNESLTFPHVETAQKLAALGKKPVQVWSALRSMEEARSLVNAGVEAILVGECIYNGMLRLPDLIALARFGPTVAPPIPSSAYAPPAPPSPGMPQQQRPVPPPNPARPVYPQSRPMPPIPGVRPPAPVAPRGPFPPKKS